MWSHALYSLRITPDFFWQLTPRQYDLLVQRHREDLAHREMVSAFTTAAVVNHSFSPPEKPIAPVQWMPSYTQTSQPASLPATAEQREGKAAFDSQVAQLTAEMKAHADTGIVGPALRALGYGNNESLG